MEKNSIKPIEVKEFVRQLVMQIEEAVDIEIRTIVNTIDIEITVMKVVNHEGKLQMYVAPGKFDGRKDEQIATVKFSVLPRESERHKRTMAEAARINEEQAKKWKI